MPSHRQDSGSNAGRNRGRHAAAPRTATRTSATAGTAANGRHRVAPPPKSRYAAVATTAILGAGVVALGTAASIPSPAVPVASAGSSSILTGIGGTHSLGDGVEALHGTVSRDAPGLLSTRASRGTVRYPLGFRPVKGGTLTSCFCWRWGAFHDGIDIAAPMLTPIYAAAAGVVESAGLEPGYGNLIVVRHDAHTITFYGHEERILVKPGQRVHAGQVIALVGNRGFSTGPHLHFGVHIDNAPVDPIPWLARRGVKI